MCRLYAKPFFDSLSILVLFFTSPGRSAYDSARDRESTLRFFRPSCALVSLGWHAAGWTWVVSMSRSKVYRGMPWYIVRVFTIYNEETYKFRRVKTNKDIWLGLEFAKRGCSMLLNRAHRRIIVSSLELVWTNEKLRAKCYHACDCGPQHAK